MMLSSSHSFFNKFDRLTKTLLSRHTCRLCLLAFDYLTYLPLLTNMSDVDRTRRSHRPSPSPSASTSNYVKPKNAAEAQKAQLDRLFSDPTKEVYIPPLPTIKGVAPPRDMIPNVQGSSAGAGASGSLESQSGEQR